MINEWLAFGIVAVICGLLAMLVRMSGDGDADADEPPDAGAVEEQVTRDSDSRPLPSAGRQTRRPVPGRDRRDAGD